MICKTTLRLIFSIFGISVPAIILAEMSSTNVSLVVHQCRSVIKEPAGSWRFGETRYGEAFGVVFGERLQEENFVRVYDESISNQSYEVTRTLHKAYRGCSRIKVCYDAKNRRAYKVCLVWQFVGEPAEALLNKTVSQIVRDLRFRFAVDFKEGRRISINAIGQAKEGTFLWEIISVDARFPIHIVLTKRGEGSLELFVSIMSVGALQNFVPTGRESEVEVDI